MVIRVRSVLLVILALLGDVECSAMTFPVEISIHMPVPEADLLLLHGRKIRQGIGRAAEVDVAKVSLAKTRALSVKESSANAEVLRSPSPQAELTCAVETNDGKAAAEVASKLSLERLNAEFKALDVPAALSVEMLTVIEIVNEGGENRPHSKHYDTQAASFPLLPVVTGCAVGLTGLALVGIVCWWQRGRKAGCHAASLAADHSLQKKGTQGGRGRRGRSSEQADMELMV